MYVARVSVYLFRCFRLCVCSAVSERITVHTLSLVSELNMLTMSTKFGIIAYFVG